MPSTIAQRRLHNLGLDRPRFDSAREVVEWLIAVQSQDFGPAKWSVAMRTKGLDDGAVDRAFAAGEILRTHVLRPTWHFVLPDDIRWLQQLTGPRVRRVLAYYDRQLGLEESTLGKGRKVIERELSKGHLTRKEIGAVLERAGVEVAGQRLGLIVSHCELDAVICSGRPKGKQQTYALVDERAPEARSLDDDEALYEFTRRYFTSHGPASVKDLQWWSSLTLSEIRRGVAMVGDELERETIDGVTYLFAPGKLPRKVTSPTVRLLQGYDEYIMGYKQTRHWLDVEGLTKDAPARTAMIGVITIDGQFTGHWKRTLATGGVRFDVLLFRDLSAREAEALEKAAREHATYLGIERVELRY